MPAVNLQDMKSDARAVSSLSAGERTAMHELMGAHYEAVPRQRFEDDLAAKDEVLMLWDDQGVLRGFTTIAWNPAGLLDAGDILFSGDTIIDRACWGTQELVRAFCRRAGQWRAARDRRLFWFLISKGHRTYMYLPLFARRFHPHPAHEEPEWEMLTGQLARAMFRDFWIPDQGVIRFPESHGHLRADLATTRANNPWVRYFLTRNPGYLHGDELACLTEMDETNLRRVALAAFREGMHDQP
jgi:hypothetical protein